MRLSKLKMSGFKSFVDPTTVVLPTNLTGVVGPNGCGKSNIIDAVRWVMGEISAKHLRGQDMTDVIFNGSGGRKPVATASVELIFDNADGALAGPYAGFAEVSLKRQVSRDGQSTYFINSAKCRRKDITQLFLGTGLGSRSYAIIEQGMISRLIEAKPDDLRAFLEEAAGISKYKERRRETESRISHTRENLDRLNDIREELDKQIRHLQRQAATAKRYETFKEEERQLKAELLALKLRDLDNESQNRVSLARERELALEAALAHLRESEAQLEHARVIHSEKGDTLNTVQAKAYSVSAEVARLEQSIAHTKQMRSRQRDDLALVEQNLSEATALFHRDQAEKTRHASELERLEPALANAQSVENEQTTCFQTAEAKLQDFQTRFDDYTRQGHDAGQRAMVEKARIEQLETNLSQSLKTRDRTLIERETLHTMNSNESLNELAEKEQAAQRDSEQALALFNQASEAVQKAREAERALQSEVDQLRSKRQKCDGQLVSLEAMQQAALGQSAGKTNAWLERHGLKDHPRLAKTVEVDSQWQKAVETVLGDTLEAVCVDAFNDLKLQELTEGSVTLVKSGAIENGANGLAAKVSAPVVVLNRLKGIECADSLADALARVNSLGADQSLITVEGIWVSKDWVRVKRDVDPRSGVLQREQQIKEARALKADLDQQWQTLEHNHLAAREAIKSQEALRDEAQEAAHRLHRVHTEVKSQRAAISTRVAQTEQRMGELKQLELELGETITTTEVRIKEARARLSAALADMERLEALRGDFDEERVQLRQTFNDEREKLDQLRRQTQQIAVEVGSHKAALKAIDQSLERIQAQLNQMTQRREELASELSNGETPLKDIEASLAQMLTERLSVEQELASARLATEEAEADLRAKDGRRVEAEGSVQAERDASSQAALAAQEIRVRRESLMEQFGETQFEFEVVMQGLNDDCSAAAWEEKVTDVTERIGKLGQVNLAAITEFKEQSERKEYIDKQFADLTEALNTLEQAIRKIDRETRERFQATFDQVNQGLGEKFPRLFNGGSAYLELIGEDILGSGVAIMARPPGKRNSSIHQLSGGEKALTAVALVFSIFELNPAPFCLLDEVDAPLDEHNVGRFCDIVKDMSERVQFLFVTHNKNTMELAKQLLGVTMNEPGVSRLVSVDVDEALRLAESA
jgi:chromosome segregation protein